MASMIINGAIAILSPMAWLMIVTGVGAPERLAARGPESLKYFTVLSNLFNGAASLAYLISCLATGAAPPELLTIKLVATAAVMLTFLTVILLLGPSLGWRKMFSGGNLWMHLVLPLMATVDCVLYVPVGTLPFAWTFAAAIPCFLYGIWYLVTLARHGAKQGDKDYDFYGFLRWGWSRVPVLAVVMIAGSWAIGLVLWLGSRTFAPFLAYNPLVP